jgi:hypothetical protein
LGGWRVKTRRTAIRNRKSGGQECPPHTSFIRTKMISVADAQRQNDPERKQRHSIYATETAGLLVIALLLLVLTLVRYWHDIHWSWR